jgi:formate transporter
MSPSTENSGPWLGIRLDALLPQEMAELAEQVGTAKASMGFTKMFTLAVLAGAFIALGAVFATTVTAGAETLPYGVVRFLGGLAFCLGLILVVVGGAELFTGNNLIVMAWAGGKVSSARLLRNWAIVYAGNFAGALSTALIIFYTGSHDFGGNAVGRNMLAIAEAKCGLGFGQAVALGVMCNALVCLAVWLCYSCRTTSGRILSIIAPISAFVAAGFEHSVANMYFVPAGLLVKSWAAPGFWRAVDMTPADFGRLSWGNFIAANLLPVTLGNILGGVGLVGLVYWFVFLRGRRT